MKHKHLQILAVMLAGFTFSGCAPLLIGAAGAVVVDEAMERDQGGDGLF